MSSSMHSQMPNRETSSGHGVHLVARVAALADASDTGADGGGDARAVCGLPQNIETLSAMFSWRVTLTPDALAYREFDPTAGQWRSMSWRAIGQRVAHFTTALAALELARGARIALLLPNGIDTVCVDQAAMAMACVPVPMHAVDNAQSIAYILADSEACVLFVATQVQWQAIASVAGISWPFLRWVVVMRGACDTSVRTEGPALLSFAQWLTRRSASTSPDAQAARPPDEEDLAALVYTSGTTGRPKGVMLSHANVLANVRATLQRVTPSASDVLLSFLPLSHTFERTVGYYLPIAVGSSVAYARSVADLAQDLRTIRPTVLVSVPRIYERIYVQLQAMLVKSRLREVLFQRAVAVGWRRFQRTQKLIPSTLVASILDVLAWPLLDFLVGRPLRRRFGGRLKIAVSGGAALSPAIARCFLSLGIPVVQGYGMTETSPVIAANGLHDNDPATVGRPLPGIDIRLGDQQELQVRGRSVMQGYLKRPDETARAFQDGWLCTGDQVAIEEGRIRILGRLKEIIVMATGEKISPADLEQAIVADPLFEQVFVVGEGRPFIACLVVLSGVHWTQFAQRLNLDPLSPASLTAASAVDAALKRVQAQTEAFPYYGQPRKVALTLAPWTVENTLLTPTLKLKRLNLETHFMHLIERLYERI